MEVQNEAVLPVSGHLVFSFIAFLRLLPFDSFSAAKVRFYFSYFCVFFFVCLFCFFLAIALHSAKAK